MTTPPDDGGDPAPARAARVQRRSPLLAARALSPDPAQPLPAVFVKAAVRHPLLYRKRVAEVDKSARPGDLVAVYHGERELLGYGLYNPRSEIAVRMLRLGPDLPDERFWTERLAAAVRLRRDTLRLDAETDAYRVIHAEADGLPGLVVDRYADVLSAEVFSLGMFQRVQALLELLAPMCGARHTVVRLGPQVLAQEGFEAEPLRSPELPEQMTIEERGTRYRVRFAGAHKTGFFCDQRDNRRQLAALCRDRSVLDLCCYTGGFAVQAKRLGGAAEVTAVDLDEEPLEIARQNANLNQVRVRFVQADVFTYMRDMLRAGHRFDVVVLDPPKLIRSRAEIDSGTRKHFDLNRLAMQLVAPGGLLLSCSCSGLLAESDFVRLLYAAARQAGPQVAGPDGAPRGTERTLQVLAKTGAAPDHPVIASCPETEYLHAVWMRLGGF
jgi:23S rRNA (cytosine1962-C5)-methyltransferase